MDGHHSNLAYARMIDSIQRITGKYPIYADRAVNGMDKWVPFYELYLGGGKPQFIRAMVSMPVGFISLSLRKHALICALIMWPKA